MIIFTTSNWTRGSKDFGIGYPLGSILRLVRGTLAWTVEIDCRQRRRRRFQTENEIYIFLYCFQIIIGWNISVFEFSRWVNVVKLKDQRTVRNLFSFQWWVDFVLFKLKARKVTVFGCIFTYNRPKSTKLLKINEQQPVLLDLVSLLDRKMNIVPKNNQ